MSSDSSTESFGERLQKLRLQAGIATQNELAISMGVSQQTVSRWEAGTSRPRKKDLLRLAQILSVHPDELEDTHDGDQTPQVVISYDQPFPIDALTADTFERFCYFFISELLHPSAKVHRYGGTGHTQNGLDIEARLKDQTILTYQCKRHAQFGPAKVKAAVTAHTRHADKKILLLTRPASPQARDEIAKYPDWELWDKEDVAKQIRKLPKSEQIRLVDIFFPGQRLALLGEVEAGPWMSVEDFFSAFLRKENAFNHLWQLVGRSEELASLKNHIGDKKTVATLLTGSGGAGKSRLLYQALIDYQNERPGTLIKVLSPGEELSTKHLENLGHGEKLLVVDDAHDRDDLPILFPYIANPKNSARAILSLRKYGFERIKLQAAAVLLQPPYTAQVNLEPLSQKQSIELATQVLNEYGGPASAAEAICQYTRDCPLATVVAAQITTKENLHPQLLGNESTFRTALLDRFQQVTAGELAQGKDRESLLAILRVLALVQPFSPDDSALLTLLETAERISIADSNRLIKVLITGGVVFKRGRTYRIAPDLLADHIIEQNCVTANGKSSGYAEKIFGQSPPAFIENILLNLGKLDWRMSNGNTASTQLLDGLWQQLRPTEEYGDPHFKAMTSVAYYQPVRALQYAEKSIADGRIHKDLPELIKYAAYNIEHVQRACACLWELGKSDGRRLNSHPDHAIRILKELCAVEPNKPVEFNQEIVAFGLSLLDLPDASAGEYTPYDFLSGILQTEGHTTTSNGREFTFSPFFVRQEAVSSLRREVIDAAIARLDSKQIDIAILSARALSDALRYPMGQFGAVAPETDRSGWTDEFVVTLNAIKDKVLSSPVDPFVWLELLSSISWHAKFAAGKTSEVAKEIFDLTPDSMEFRTIRALIDGYGHLIENPDFETRQREWQETIQKTANEITNAFKTPEEAVQFSANTLEKIDKIKQGQGVSPHILLHELLASSASLASPLLEYALDNPQSAIGRHIPIALPKAYEEDVEKGRKFTQRILATDSRELKKSLACCLSLLLEKSSWGEYEYEVVEQFLSSDDQQLVTISAGELRRIGTENASKALELIRSVNLCGSQYVADEVLSLFGTGGSIPLDLVDVDTVNLLLEQMLLIPVLDKYWIQQFFSEISARHPMESLAFFKERVEHASSMDDYSFRPCNYGPYMYKPLQFIDSPSYDDLCRDVWSWIIGRDEDDHRFQHFASHLFTAVFSLIDERVMSFMRNKFAGDSRDILLIGRILRDAQHSFTLDNPSFAIEYLTAAKSHGSECLQTATSALYCAAVSGGKQGTPGEPFPRDVEALKKADSILETLPRFSPAYRLYDLIKRDAEKNIADSIKDRELFEE